MGKRLDALVLRAAAPIIRRFVGGVAEDANDVLHKLLTLGDDRNVRAAPSTWRASTRAHAHMRM